jgi:hypothetical protein
LEINENHEMFLATTLFETSLHWTGPQYQILPRLADLIAKLDSGALCELFMESTPLLEQKLLSLLQIPTLTGPMFLRYCVK